MLNLQSLISMGVQAMQLMGKKKVIFLRSQVWNEYQKYPRTPDGLKQAMKAHNLDTTSVHEAYEIATQQRALTICDIEMLYKLVDIAKDTYEMSKTALEVAVLAENASAKKCELNPHN